MKNRTIIGIITFILAIAVVFGVSPIVNKLSVEKIDVVQVNKRVTEGTRLTAADLVIVSVGKAGLPGSVITDEKAVINKYATTDLYPGVSLIQEMITDTAINSEAVLKTLDDGHAAISVSVPSYAAALSAKLQNGDIVSIVVSTNEATFIPRELTYVRVITTTTDTGIDQDQIDASTEDADKAPSTITLLVTPLQAKTLAQYEVKGDMHFMLISRNDEDKAESLLHEQDKILAEVQREQDRIEAQRIADEKAMQGATAPIEVPVEPEITEELTEDIS